MALLLHLSCAVKASATSRRVFCLKYVESRAGATAFPEKPHGTHLECRMVFYPRKWSQQDCSAFECRSWCRLKQRRNWPAVKKSKCIDDGHHTRNSGEAQLQDWRALFCELHSGRSLSDTRVGIGWYVPFTV